MDRLHEVGPVNALGHVLDAVPREGAREDVTQYDFLSLALHLLRALLHLPSELDDGLLEAGDLLPVLLVPEPLLLLMDLRPLPGELRLLFADLGDLLGDPALGLDGQLSLPVAELPLLLEQVRFARGRRRELGSHLRELLVLDPHPVLGLAREPLAGSVGLLHADAGGLVGQPLLEVELESLLALRELPALPEEIGPQGARLLLELPGHGGTHFGLEPRTHGGGELEFVSTTRTVDRGSHRAEKPDRAAAPVGACTKIVIL